MNEADLIQGIQSRSVEKYHNLHRTASNALKRLELDSLVAAGAIPVK